MVGRRRRRDVAEQGAMFAERVVREEGGANSLPLLRSQKVMMGIAADVSPPISRGVRLYTSRKGHRADLFASGAMPVRPLE